MGLNDDSILKNNNFITGTQDYPSVLTSRTGETQYHYSTLTSRKGNSKKPSNVTPYKGHRKNLVTSSTLKKIQLIK